MSQKAPKNQSTYTTYICIMENQYKINQTINKH